MIPLSAHAQSCVAWKQNDTMVNTCRRTIGVGYSTYDGSCRPSVNRPFPCSFALAPRAEHWFGTRVSHSDIASAAMSIREVSVIDRDLWSMIFGDIGRA